MSGAVCYHLTSTSCHHLEIIWGSSYHHMMILISSYKGLVSIVNPCFILFVLCRTQKMLHFNTHPWTKMLPFCKWKTDNNETIRWYRHGHKKSKTFVCFIAFLCSNRRFEHIKGPYFVGVFQNFSAEEKMIQQHWIAPLYKSRLPKIWNICVFFWKN